MTPISHPLTTTHDNTTESPALSSQQAFAPAFEEIARRRQVFPQSEEADRYFERAETSMDLPWDIPGQQFVLVTMATTMLGPRTLDRRHPSLRFYGAFGTREEALDHKETLERHAPDCSFAIVPRGEWILVPQSEEELTDPLPTIRRRLEEYEARRQSGWDHLRDTRETEVPDGSLPPARPSTPVTLDEDEDDEARKYRPTRLKRLIQRECECAGRRVRRQPAPGRE